MKLKEILSRRRSEAFVVTKANAQRQTRDGILEQIEESLARMGVGEVDLVHIHNLGDFDMETLFKPDGALATYQRIATEYRDSFNAPLALFSEVPLLKAKNQIAEARHVCETILTQYRESFIAGEAARQLRMTRASEPAPVASAPAPVAAQPPAAPSAAPTVAKPKPKPKKK